MNARACTCKIFFVILQAGMWGRTYTLPGNHVSHLSYNILCILSSDFEIIQKQTILINNFMQTIKLKRGLNIPFDDVCI